jgi:hypothetical protein
MAGYQDTSSHLDGDTIFAQDDKAQFALLNAAFNNTTGHKHDGSVGEGDVVDRIGLGAKTLQVSSAGVVGTQLNTDLSVATNPSDVKVPSDSAVEVEIARVEAKVDTNATNIGTNDTDIATNVTNIATNVTNIATNTGNIATNVTNIATNTGDITTLQAHHVWIPKNSSFTVEAGELYTVDGSSGAVEGILEIAYVIGDVITVHNEAASTNLVRLLNTTMTIVGVGTTITSSDNLELEPGNTVRLLARTTTILEVL